MMEKITIFIQKKEPKRFHKQKKIPWQRLIFAITIVSTEELNCCVRDGNRCFLFVIVTKEF